MMAPKAKPAQESSSIASAAGFELADLFEYRIAQPVTIKKNESAMLPFLQDKIKARKVDVYSDTTASHPLNAAELVNSTSKTLDGGPITVYDRGGYVGEALVETVKANDKRLISYGVDLGTRITTRLDSEERDEREIHLVRGVLQIKAATIRKTNYSIHNVDAKAKTLIIEHALADQFHVLNQKPTETTSTARRFEVKLDPSSTQAFPIVEEKVLEQTVGVASLSPNVLVQYMLNKHLSEAGHRALAQIVDLKRKIAGNSGEVDLTDHKVAAITQDEERVRKNLGSLNGVSGQQELVQKYATQLAQLEQQIATLRDHQNELANKGNALQASLDEQIEKLTF
jgi:predicted transcriptional regulator